jgi:tRNA (cytidine/uridine-2'-O-)-methyltransferase
MINIALYKPEIPPNTGNIARLCVGISAKLHIIDKPSFDLSEKAVRRAGLDYWDSLDLELHPDWESFLKKITEHKRLFLVTKFADTLYDSVKYTDEDYFLFGQETKGVPETISSFFSSSNKIAIPMNDKIRSLNLSNSVAIIAYEALRQIGFEKI